MTQNIYVTSPLLPPLEELIPDLERIWQNKNLTNNGEYHKLLEKALCDYLGINQISLFNNGTIGLITAIKSLNLSGEVITTPYSFVATSHSLTWSNLTPVFVDIDPATFNIDPSKIEAAITKNTTAILAVHCYGIPCNTSSIDKIAKHYNLKVIYDAAHAFGVSDDGGSILRHGDTSVLSFHATKTFNTFEGGAVISPTLEQKNNIDQLKNFGFVDETTVTCQGINGKMSEFNAAFGLLQLRYIDKAIESRKAIDQKYKKLLQKISGIKTIDIFKEFNSNYSYFPVIVEDNFPIKRDGLYERLKTNNIFSRRYFYPLISEFPMYSSLPSANRENLKNAYDISKKILCLPIYPDLDEPSIEKICELIATA
jgi:dTDP-4-amino-4,6-dideoxygalactose transaminase